jgi:hypothetical protein
MHLFREHIYEAETGKVFQRKGTDNPLDTLVLIGNGDSIDNYEEVDKPTEDENGDN